MCDRLKIFAPCLLVLPASAFAQSVRVETPVAIEIRTVDTYPAAFSDCREAATATINSLGYPVRPLGSTEVTAVILLGGASVYGPGGNVPTTSDAWVPLATIYMRFTTFRNGQRIKVFSASEQVAGQLGRDKTKAVCAAAAAKMDHLESPELGR